MTIDTHALVFSRGVRLEIQIGQSKDERIAGMRAYKTFCIISRYSLLVLL